MAAPIGNTPGNPVSRERATPAEQNLVKPDHSPSAKGDAAAVRPEGGDRVSLSDAGRRLSVGEESGRGPDSPDEAAELVARLRDRMQQAPGLAVAAQTANAHSRLAGLVDQFGLR